MYQISTSMRTPDQVFFVRSMEQSHCPICQSSVKVIGSRHRILIEDTGEIKTLVIRRLKCQNPRCARIHHELPHTVVPYRRHCAGTIEAIFDAEGFEPIDMDESVIRRIREWFEVHKDAIHGGLLGLAALLGTGFAEEPSVRPKSVLERIHALFKDRPGWLSQTVRILVNHCRWPHTRSASMS